MASFDFFRNPEDLEHWIRSRESGDKATQEILDVANMMGHEDIIDISVDISQKCKEIFESQESEDINDASEMLMGVLANMGITRMNKKAEHVKTANSRQRNNWERGKRNKFNRIVCSEVNENTQWRRNRDQFYDFTHYTTDAITFDEDPDHVYSGEALWRMYIMDKFTREHQDKNGKWVGGYINDRFHVFPDAGTPANPDVPRDGGNQMGLAPGERTRKPRPHQYSTERRLEEARGNKTEDLEVTASKCFGNIVKVAGKLPEERHENNIYNIFRDSIDMREAGFEYGDMLEKISDHYDVPLKSVAKISLLAKKMKNKHDGIGYSNLNRQALMSNNTVTLITTRSVPAIAGQQRVEIEENTPVVQKDPNQPVFQIVDGPDVNKIFQLANPNDIQYLQPIEEQPGDIQNGAEETGLLE